jgi:putative oxidoreductase
VGFLKPYQEQIYALTRIVAGLMFMLHGLDKLLLVLGGESSQLHPLLFWGAMIIELVGGILIAVGLFAAPAAFIASGSMAVAYFLVHQIFFFAREGFGLTGFSPLVNKGELAALYCWLFFYVAARGPGIWSVDAARGAD